MEIEVVIKEGFGVFEPDKKLGKVMDDCGYTSIDSIESRINSKIIQFIKENGINNGEKVSYLGQACKITGTKAKLSLIKVDTKKIWAIDDYDGSEGILYLNLNNKELNYHKIE